MPDNLWARRFDNKTNLLTSSSLSTNYFYQTAMMKSKESGSGGKNPGSYSKPPTRTQDLLQPEEAVSSIIGRDGHENVLKIQNTVWKMYLNTKCSIQIQYFAF